MQSKVMVIISTGEKEKALTGILYAANALKNNWLDDVQVFFFGPFEKLVTEDEEVQEKVAKLAQYNKPTACRFLSDKSGVTEKLEGLGYDVEYVGSMVSEAIKDGYVPMVF